MTHRLRNEQIEHISKGLASIILFMFEIVISKSLQALYCSRVFDDRLVLVADPNTVCTKFIIVLYIFIIRELLFDLIVDALII